MRNIDTPSTFTPEERRLLGVRDETRLTADDRLIALTDRRAFQPGGLRFSDLLKRGDLIYMGLFRDWEGNIASVWRSSLDGNGDVCQPQHLICFRPTLWERATFKLSMITLRRLALATAISVVIGIISGLVGGTGGAIGGFVVFMFTSLFILDPDHLDRG